MKWLSIGLLWPKFECRRTVYSLVEVSERLVGSPAFKAGVRCDPS